MTCCASDPVPATFKLAGRRFIHRHCLYLYARLEADALPSFPGRGAAARLPSPTGRCPMMEA